MSRPERSRPLRGGSVFRRASGCKSRHGKRRCAVQQTPAEEERSSRPQRSVESLSVSRRRGVRREQIRGPSMKRTLQPRDIEAERRGGRAGHVAAKATDIVPVPERTVDAPGVWRRARGEGSTGNRRDPTRRPTSGEGGAYKPSVKWRRAGRESEGLIVPRKAVKAAGGKGPCLDHAWDWG